MNAKEAKEIVKKWDDACGCPADQDRNIGYAHGYLAALRGPEVAALVKALEEGNDCEDCDTEGCLRCEALAQFQESLKP